MVELGNVREWQGRPVLDAEGEKLGKLEDVYFNADYAPATTESGGRLVRR